jgi:hypothetical protein
VATNAVFRSFRFNRGEVYRSFRREHYQFLMLQEMYRCDSKQGGLIAMELVIQAFILDMLDEVAKKLYVEVPTAGGRPRFKDTGNADLRRKLLGENTQLSPLQLRGLGGLTYNMIEQVSSEVFYSPVKPGTAKAVLDQPFYNHWSSGWWRDRLQPLFKVTPYDGDRQPVWNHGRPFRQFLYRMRGFLFKLSPQHMTNFDRQIQGEMWRYI